MISLGFAAIENIKYVFSSEPGTEFFVAFARMFTWESLFMHPI